MSQRKAEKSALLTLGTWTMLRGAIKVRYGEAALRQW